MKFCEIEKQNWDVLVIGLFKLVVRCLETGNILWKCFRMNFFSFTKTCIISVFIIHIRTCFKHNILLYYSNNFIMKKYSHPLPPYYHNFRHFFANICCHRYCYVLTPVTDLFYWYCIYLGDNNVSIRNQWVTMVTRLSSELLCNNHLYINVMFSINLFFFLDSHIMQFVMI